MIIIQGRTGTGKTTELVKRFMKDPETSFLFVTENTIQSIIDRTNALREQGIPFKNAGNKKFGVVGDEYLLEYIKEELAEEPKTNLYIDAHVSNQKEEILEILKDLEEEYNIKITITQHINKTEGKEGLTDIIV